MNPANQMYPIPLRNSFPNFAFFLFFLVSLTTIASPQEASIREETRTVLTYRYSDPNPLPVMAINSMVSPFYPYCVFDGYSDKAVSQDWKVITLENDYIKLCVLPGIGGKVWGAVEKSTGDEFIYLNKVMKFRAIGIRGPWTSGGIEHNFGLDLGHAPWTSSQVDYVTLENPDGSVSCVVGGLDLASRTQWRVNILLDKDKACFETRSMWYNPTPLHDAYLSWENAGFRASDDLQFYFPGTYYIGHDGSVSDWPVDREGRNLSLYRANNFGSHKSYHVSGLYTGWFGGYWHADDFGFGHYAPYSDAPGKKIWIWSLARDGAIWEDLLTDSDGQYIEAQSGVKFNQANRESGFDSPFNQLSMRPHYTETKTDYWFPVKNTRGMVDASPAGVLNVEWERDSLEILISPNIMIHDSLIVKADGRRHYSEYLKLLPMQAFHRTIRFQNTESTNTTVEVGNNLLFYSSDPDHKRTDRPSRSAEKADFGASEHFFRLAEDENAMRNYPEAMEYYLACLRKEPTHSRALTRVAELYYRKADYEEGLRFARRVLENDTYDAEANFVSGTIHRRLGNTIMAEELFSIAARTMEYRSASYLEIAGIKMGAQDFSEAIQYAKKALDFNRLNIPAYELLATGCRKLGKSKEASETLAGLLELDPLNHYARFEQYLLQPDESVLKRFNSAIRNELPHETYLELALSFVNAGLTEEATRVLEQAPPYPTVYYWLAYLSRDKSREKSTKYLNMAMEMSPERVFPFRPEIIPVLNWAMEQHESWKTAYYLGLIYWHIGQPEKARGLFEQCGDTPDYAPFYMVRGILFRQRETEPCFPCSDFDRAVKIDPDEWRTWHYLIDFMETRGAFRQQYEHAKQAFEQFPANPVIGIDYARSLLQVEDPAACLELLEKVVILPQEGAHEGHDIYEAANLMLAVDRLEKKKYREAVRFLDASENWPENLGAGKPFEPDTRLQDFLSAFCYKQMGNMKIADDHLNRIAGYSKDHWGSAGNPVNTWISVLVLNDRGQHHEVVRAMDGWKAEQDSLRNWRISAGSASPGIQWILALYNHDMESAESLEKEIAAGPHEFKFHMFTRALLTINRNKNEK